MLAAALASLVLLGAPEPAKISYKKRVMVDPAYQPSQTRDEIEKTLRRVAQPPRPRPVVVYESPRESRRYRVRRTAAWAVPLAVGIGLAAIAHNNDWDYGFSFGYPYYGYGLRFGYYRHHRHHRHYRHGGHGRHGRRRHR